VSDMNPADLEGALEQDIPTFVRSVLARSPSASYYEVLQNWSEAHDAPVSAEEARLLRATYDELAPRRGGDEDATVAGVVVGLGLQLLQIPLALAAGWLACQFDRSGYCALAAIAPVMFIGVSQLLYMAPALIAAFVWKRGLVKGLLIAAGVTFLLNAGCYAGLFGLSSGV
jgi:hypothetical protein